MLWSIAVILIVIWAVLFLFMHIASPLIHLLVGIAIIVIIYRLVTGRPVV